MSGLSRHSTAMAISVATTNAPQNHHARDQFRVPAGTNRITAITTRVTTSAMRLWRTAPDWVGSSDIVDLARLIARSHSRESGNLRYASRESTLLIGVTKQRSPLSRE